MVACTVACATSAPPARTKRTPIHHPARGAIRLSLDAMRNDLIVPQARTGAGFGLALRYAPEPDEGIVRAEFGFGARYALAGTRGIVFDHGLRVRYAAPVIDDLWHVGFGPAFGWETDLVLLETRDDAKAYWMTNRWLGVTATAWRALDARWRLELAFEVMVVAVQSRPPGHLASEAPVLVPQGVPLGRRSKIPKWLPQRGPEADPRLAWFGDTQRLRLAFDVWRPWSTSAIPSGWAVGVEARLLRASEPGAFTILEFALHLTYMWGLR